MKYCIDIPKKIYGAFEPENIFSLVSSTFPIGKSHDSIPLWYVFMTFCYIEQILVNTQRTMHFGTKSLLNI